jgi:CDP-paratose 2-epimerase
MGRQSHADTGLSQASRAAAQRQNRPVLITGGAGFIGTNLAHRLLSTGQPVLLFDNLSRAGVEGNLQWLLETHGDDLVEVQLGDVRNAVAVREAVLRASAVFHFAAQVSVSNSLTNPFLDFEVNAHGTLNVLEALRAIENPPPLVFSSTNKVYGTLAGIRVSSLKDRYQPKKHTIRTNGINEKQTLEFRSPYGCSKGAADQYVIDYARTFQLPAVVFRLSCVFGPHQVGSEHQGWIAYFLMRATQNCPITIYGDGMQVRDALFIDDLVEALLIAQNAANTLAGEAFNIGGGPSNAISLLELIEIINKTTGSRCDLKFSAWRPADQRYYVSDTRSFQLATGWTPKVSLRTGVEKVYDWFKDSRFDQRALLQQPDSR